MLATQRFTPVAGKEFVISVVGITDKNDWEKVFFSITAKAPDGHKIDFELPVDWADPVFKSLQFKDKQEFMSRMKKAAAKALLQNVKTEFDRFVRPGPVNYLNLLEGSSQDGSALRWIEGSGWDIDSSV